MPVMKRVVVAWLLLSPTCAQAATAPPGEFLREWTSYQFPEGWRPRAHYDLDHGVIFSTGSYTILIQLLGGVDSRHVTPARFLESGEGTDGGGRQARVLRKVLVGGSKRPLYYRDFRAERLMSDPSGPGGRLQVEIGYVSEEFCLVPVDSPNFLLLRYSATGPAPRPSLEPQRKVWSAFLSSIRRR